MRLSRLGSLHQSRLSFMRILTRRMATDAWRFSRPVFDIDHNGVGHAVYAAQCDKRTYSLVAFAHDLPDDLRSDRVIAEAWDATFALFDGIPTREDITRLAKNVPLQEAGRVTESELTLSRANRSVRLWNHVIDCLSNGRQPDPDQIAQVGYLMRTTAVYGSGKFGAADRCTFSGRAEMAAPFQAEMLTVYLIRTFVRDLAEYMAVLKGGENAVPLDPVTAQQLGIGNSTGLGMAPFLINHPVLFNNWIMVREEAIARVRSIPMATQSEIDVFLELFRRSMETIKQWRSDHAIQKEKLNQLRMDLNTLEGWLPRAGLSQESPWDRLYLWAEENLSEEGQEYTASLMLEPYGALVDGLADCMASAEDHVRTIDGTMRIKKALTLIQDNYPWALKIDWGTPASTERAWYVSEEKLEPRLGNRFEEPLEEFEQPLAPARDVVALYNDMKHRDGEDTVAQFLLCYPQHRNALRRVQITEFAPYAEIWDNTVDGDMLPIDMLRCKLSFFGATRFDPRSDRWIRICMYQGAPYPEQLNEKNADHWVYPPVGS